MSSACPICKAPASEGLPRCGECLVSFDWRSGAAAAHHPFIKPGDPLYFTELTRGCLPGRDKPKGTLSDGTKFEPTPHGALVTVMPKRAFEAFEPRLRCRDMCVRASFVALDPGVTLSCLGRIDTIQTAKLKYVLEIDPGTRRFCLDLGFSSPEVAQFVSLMAWTPSGAIAPVGHVNVIELRLQGPTLEARINDQHVGTFHDAVLGIGAAGLRISTKPAATTPSRATVQWFEMRQVAA